MSALYQIFLWCLVLTIIFYLLIDIISYNGVHYISIHTIFSMILDFLISLTNFIPVALADEAVDTVSTATDAVSSSSWTSVAPLLLIMVVFYFLVIRPQQKKVKEHQNMLGGLKKGDKVITSGGIMATIVRIDNDNNVLTLEIADNVNIKVKREFVGEIVTPQGT